MKPISSESYSAAVTRDDAHELASFGYTQQLRRTLGSFSSFAVAFSLISVITGVTANLVMDFNWWVVGCWLPG